MMKIRTIISTLLLSAAALAAGAQESNILRVPAVDGVEGRTISVPVELSNTNPDITAMQFMVSIPEVLSTRPESVTLTDRKTDHVVSTTFKGAGRYLVVVYSPTNSPIRLNSGAVINIPCTVSSGLNEGQTYPITLEDVILSDRDGDNVLSLSESGTFRVRNGADFTVENVTALSSSVKPGEKLSLSYTVKNVGGSASGQWSEQAYLISDAGDECFIGRNKPAETSLAAGTSVQRTVEFSLPQMPGLDGKSKVMIKVVPENEDSEPVSYRDNNTGETAGSTVSVAGVLSLTPDKTVIDETSGKSVKCKITRSGSWKAAQTFAIAAEPADTRLLMPESVEIPAGQSGAYFLIKVIDNNEYDGNDTCHINVSGNGYTDARISVTINDDERPALHLSGQADTLTEGESTTLTIERTNLLNFPLTVTLSCEMPSRFTFPATVSFNAGENSKTVSITAVDNDIVEADAMPSFMVSAPGFDGDEYPVTLKDNDAPELKLTLTPQIVPENAGPVAVTAKLRRMSGSDGKIKVVLTDDSGKDIYYHNRSVTLEKGQTELEFPIGVIDNAEVTGDRIVNITAAVNISSCDCTVATDSKGASTASLEITEDDGPALSLSLARSTIIAGDKEGVTLTVSRNSVNSAALDVTLSGNDDNIVEYPATVTIPAGNKSAEAKIYAKSTASIEEDTFITLVGEAEGYAKGSCVMMMSHRNYPDASIPSLTLDRSEAFSGDKIKVSVVVRNEGVTSLPEATRININIADRLATSVYTTRELASGEEESLSAELQPGNRIGVRQVYASVNDNRQIRELNYANNRSRTANVEVKAPYSATVKAEKSLYLKEETVALTGIVSGRNVSGQPVEIYIINEGLRQTLTATTDETGAFQAVFKPYAIQKGHFALGACYPGENKKDEMASFEIMGIDRTDNLIIKNEVYVNESVSGSFGIKNTGSHAFSGMTVKVLSAPDACKVKASCAATLAGNGTANVEYTLQPGSLTEGTKYQTVNLKIETAEGATLEVPVYYYCLSPKGLLKSELSKLSTRMIKGETREYPLTVTNRGDGATGEISLSDPTWISVENGRIPSLAPGESAKVILLLTPEESFQLNSIREGSIAFNCENGNGFVLPFAIETVSQSNGVLLVDAVDEYTYYTSEAPHLAGAKVLVQHPVTGVPIAQGTTDSNGHFSVQLPEGFYELTVSADKHSTYNGTVVVEPGDEATYTLVSLGYKGHHLTFDVKKTEIEDTYDVSTREDYETNVPVPVVTIDGPRRFNGDDMADGESILLTYTLTNHGLISALNTQFIVPENSEEWTWQALAYSEPFELRAKESVEIPVKVTRHITARHGARSVGTDILNNYQNCIEKYKVLYEHMCGEDLKKNASAKEVLMKLCADEAIATGLMGALFNQGWGGSGPGGSGGAPDYSGDNHSEGSDREPAPFSKEHTLCNPCWADFAGKNYDRAIGWIPGGEKIVKARNDAYKMAQKAGENGGQGGNGNGNQDGEGNGGQGDNDKPGDDSSSTRPIRDFITEEALDFMSDGQLKDLTKEVADLANDAIDYEECMKDLGKRPATGDKSMSRSPRKARKIQSWVLDHVNNAKILKEQYDHYLAGMNEFYGDSIWMSSDDPTIATFLNAFGKMDDWTVEKCLPLKPAAVTTAQLVAFVERMNNTVNGNGDNRFDIKFVTDELIATEAADKVAAEKGYTTMTALYVDSGKEFRKRIDEESSAVCASVGLAIDQTLSMTREAFNGYLEIFNGDDESPMEDIIFKLEVRNLSTGEKVTSREMQIDVTELETFGGEPVVGSAWTLNAQATGKATIQFIPTRYAAPEHPVDYSFGGVITYLDPITGMQVSEKLMPVIKTVSPSPVLDLTYFMQRDVYGDDPLTEEVVEPSEDAEMALVVHNKGYGDAHNVRLMTKQPRIIDNEKGLLIDFSIESSQINGSEKVLSLGEDVAMEIGTIPASHSSLLQWWLRSSLLGHFTDYDVDYTHVSSHGNENLSLIDQLSIHELIRGFSLPDEAGAKGRGFLVNDLTDRDDMPDAVYFSDGSDSRPLNTASSVRMSYATSNEYIVEIVPSASGWNYGFTPDKTGGRKVITAIHRVSDNAEMPLDNFWQTSVTLRDGQEPLHQYLIHAVTSQKDTESYRLSFADRQDVELDVSGIELVRTGSGDDRYVSDIRVTFNKDIDPSSFTAEDILLFRDGNRCALGDNPIETVSGNEFKVNIGSLATRAGVYELKVRSNNVLDADGYPGNTNRSVTWTQLKDISGSVDDLYADGCQVRIYPLPMRDNITIECDGKCISSLEVIDSTGAVVRRWTEIPAGGSVNVSGLASGLYVLRISSENGLYVKKAFKL